ncbi:sugar ABC transporter permease [Cytobacillus oceanisediminis]|uniref:Sugar ABC transporter permease n=1 Tax=Cytobacillus firmus TaxID=1399 RepID=A0AA46P554_CYTFI|nr:sugar ABC transporter permease [Cytobacillus oceanisediminis]MCS0651963.1 sugar ABC transporter permease [Cytobacillus firmus]UYG97847.1 sugar ABC transporter permease [Cytobacillus firmus]
MERRGADLAGKKEKASHRRLSRQTRENIFGYLFISPWIIGFLGLTLGPLLFSLFASFTDYNITSKMNFIGLDNFKRMFTIDDLFKTSLWNTLYYVLFSVPLTTAGAIFLSVLLNQKVKGMKFFRTLYYLPAILSGVAVYFLWMQLLSPSTGLVNTFLAWFGIEGPAWLFDPEWTKPALLLMKMWSVGGGMLLYLASLQGVSNSLYEAADLDGAGVVQKFFYITLPMISPIIFFDVLTSTIGSFQIFQEAYVMTENGSGGPGNSLLFYNLHMWNNAFEVFDMGYASAMAWLLFIVVMILTIINMKIGKKWVHYEGGDDK